MSKLLRGWGFSRAVRLALGIAAAIYALTSKEYIFFALAGILTAQAIFNVACCGASGCSTAARGRTKIN